MRPALNKDDSGFSKLNNTDLKSLITEYDIN